MSAVEVTDLSVGYPGRPVLSGVHLTVPAGARAAILGASGDGKTTLLRSVAGFLRPTRGTIEVAGRVLSGPTVLVPPERRDIGYVRQDGVLFPHLDVTGNIAFGLRRSRTRHAVVAELLELVGLGTELARRRPDELSGGQQQRVALARALARRPAVVLLDEPFSSLDVSLRAATRSATAAALAERGATAVLVTHDQAEALSFADQVAVLVAGTMRQSGPPRELYEYPADLEVARLLGDVVMLDGTIAGGVLHCALGPLPAGDLPNGPVRVVLRPEQLAVIEPRHAAATGVVGGLRYQGADTVVDVALELGPIVQARTGGRDALRPGQQVGLAVTGPIRVGPRADAMCPASGEPPHAPLTVAAVC